MVKFDFADRVQLYHPSEPLNEVPARPGIYILFDEEQRVRRMVTTRDLRARARYYLHDRESDEAMSVARRESTAMGWIETFSRFETHYAHLSLFRSYFPASFQLLYRMPSPYLLRVTFGEAYPRLLPVRSAQEKDHVHIGPYLNREMVERDMHFINDLLDLRRCDYELVPFHPYERCLYYQMQTCVAPCDAYSQPAYRQLVQDALDILEGNTENILALLNARRDHAASQLEFELAMKWRDEAKNVRQWSEVRPDFVRPLDKLNLVIPQRTEFGLDLFVVRGGALIDWKRISEPDPGKVAIVLSDSFGGAATAVPWRAMREDFAFLSRWLWNRDYNAHVMVDDPVEAASLVMDWITNDTIDIADEGREEDLPLPDDDVPSGSLADQNEESMDPGAIPE